MEIIWNLLIEWEFISIIKYILIKRILIIKVICWESTVFRVPVQTIIRAHHAPSFNLEFSIKDRVISENVWLEIVGDFILWLHVSSKFDHTPIIICRMAITSHSYGIKSSFKPNWGVFSVESSDCCVSNTVFWIAEWFSQDDIESKFLRVLP